MPALFKTQRQIPQETLPSPEEKLEMLQQSIELLVADGYVYIGMDHFAKPHDSLVKAQQQGSLQRNFQGYSTHGDCDLLAFGVSAISAIDGVLVQNHKQLDHYNQAIDQGRLATSRGMTLSAEDRLRGTIIMQLICHFSLDIQLIENQFQICFAQHFAKELNALEPMAMDGLISLTSNEIRVLDSGRLLIRAICMVFDAYLKTPAQAQAQASQTRPKKTTFSQII